MTTIVKTSEVARLLDCIGPLLIEAHANGHVGDAAVSVPYHILNDVETLLENVQRKQQDALKVARKRTRLLVEIEVDEEPIPGFGHNPQDFAEAAAKAAIRPLGCYNPTIVTTGWGPADQAG